MRGHCSGEGQFTVRLLPIADGKGLTGSPRILVISAATALESTPPLRNTPSGTSLIRWLSTDFEDVAIRPYVICSP